MLFIQWIGNRDEHQRVHAHFIYQAYVEMQTARLSIQIVYEDERRLRISLNQTLES